MIGPEASTVGWAPRAHADAGVALKLLDSQTLRIVRRVEMRRVGSSFRVGTECLARPGPPYGIDRALNAWTA